MAKQTVTVMSIEGRIDGLLLVLGSKKQAIPRLAAAFDRQWGEDADDNVRKMNAREARESVVCTLEAEVPPELLPHANEEGGADLSDAPLDWLVAVAPNTIRAELREMIEDSEFVVLVSLDQLEDAV